MTGLSNNNDLGTIEVSVRRVCSEYTLVPYYPGGFNPVGSVHERSKKAGAHSVSYVPIIHFRQAQLKYTNLSLGKGTRISGQPHEYLESRAAVDPHEGYVAVFVFRYRPKGGYSFPTYRPIPELTIDQLCCKRRGLSLRLPRRPSLRRARRKP